MFVITKQYKLSSLHRLHEKSEDLKCQSLHGHEYLVQVSLQFADAPISGLMICRSKMDQVVQQQLLHVFKGESLHQKLKFSSGEFLVHEFQQRLKIKWPLNKVRVSLQETRKNFFSSQIETSPQL